MSLHVLVLAGGSGTRLWPLSRAAVPKHLLPLGPGGQTLLRATVERVLPLGASVHVVTVAAQEQACREALTGLSGSVDVIAEPAARGTGPALGLATLWIAAGDPDALVCSVHADHDVGDDDAYRLCVWAAAGWARATSGLATVGLVPRYPNTGLGYVAMGDRRAPGAWSSPGGMRGTLDTAAAAVPAHAGAGFVEKPPAAVAEAYVRDGGHLWNLGLFAWPATVFERELRAADDSLADRLAAVVEARLTGDEVRAAALYTAAPTVAVDPLIFERTANLTVVRAEFPWSDLGSWSDLHDVRAVAGEADAAGNVVAGDALCVNAQGCTVEARGGRLVAVVGAEEMVVIDTPDAVLVVPRARAQQVKDAVEALRARGRADLL